MRITLLTSLIVFATAASANGQTSSQLATGKPTEAYSYFKRALESLRAGKDEANIRKEERVVPLTSCNDASDYIGYDGDKNSILEKTANLAYDVLYLQAALQVAGYPTDIWRSDLVEYERSNLAAINQYEIEISEHGSPAKQRLAKKLNEFKKRSGGRYKNIIPQAEGCGAGEVQVKIRTSPSAQRVQYINLIKYNLCTFHGLDPQGARCDLWTDYSAASRDGAFMSGRYKIRAMWSDGTTVLRDLNVDNLVEDRDGGYSFAITKR